MRDATVVCGAAVTVTRSAAVQCGAVATVQAVVDAGYVVPMNGIDVALGVNAPNDDWLVSTATVDVGTINIDTLLLYTPPADFTGVALIDYTLTDGTTTINATLTLTVADLNPIAAVADVVHVLQNSSANILAVRLNDTGDGQITNASVDVGTVTIGPAGPIYTPPVGYSGPYNGTYEVEPT